MSGSTDAGPTHRTAGYILVLLSHAPDHDSRVRNQLRLLTGAGHQVTLLGLGEAGEYVDRYEECEGARVHVLRRWPKIPLAWILFNSLSGLVLPLMWRRFRKAALALPDRPNLVIAHDLDTLPAGTRIGRRLGIPVLYDAHENFPAMMATASWKPFLRRKLHEYFMPRIFAWLEKRHLPRAAVVTTVCQPNADRLFAWGAQRVNLVLNAKPLLERSAPPNQGREIRACYFGGVNEGRHVIQLVDAVRGIPDAELVIAGPTYPEFLRRLEAALRSTPNARYLGILPSDQVLPETAGSDLVICPLNPNEELLRDAFPNKFFEALATGRPFLTYQGTYVAGLVEEHGVGLVVPPTIDGLREGFRRLAGDPRLREEMGQRAHNLARTHGWNWHAQGEKFLTIVADLVAQDGRS